MTYSMQNNAIRSDWVGRVVDGTFPLLEWRGGSAGIGVFLTEGPGGPKAAIKLIPGDRAALEERLAGWAAAAELSHPHLMRVWQTGRDSIEGVELAYAVTEYADEVLAEVLRERPLGPAEAREMLESVLDTLAYLHGQGFVHGHVKPSNITAVDDRLKLAGDDLQRAGHRGPRAAEEGIFAAPEIAAGLISPAADLWSLGATLVEVLTEHPPAFDARANQDPVVPDSVPEPFNAIARACLRRAPRERATLDQVWAMLENNTIAPIEPARPAAETALTSAIAEAAKIETTSSESEKDDAGFRLRIKTPAKSRVTALLAFLVAVAAAIAIFAALSHKARQPAQSGNEAPAPATAQPGEQQAPEPAGGPAGSDGRESQSPAAVTEKGEVTGRVMPAVPVKASQTIHGKVQVEVRVAVDPEGNISKADFASRGVSRYFANLALEAARHWRFAPARVGGQAVQSVWVLRFVFRESGTEVSARESSP